MTNHFPDDQARAEFEQWHDEQPDAAIIALASSLRRPEPAKPTTAQVAARYKKLAETALQAMVAYEAWANCDPAAKRNALADAHTQAELEMGEAFAAVLDGYDHDWLDTMRENAGLVFDECSGEWVDPTEYRAAQHEARSYADTAAHAWSAR